MACSILRLKPPGLHFMGIIKVFAIPKKNLDDLRKRIIAKCDSDRNDPGVVERVR